MSKKCVKCGQLLPEKASFCPHCTAVQTEKQEVKAPGRWKKKVVTGAVLAVLAAAVGMAFSQYHRPRSYEGGAQIIYPNEEKSYKVLLTFSEGTVRFHASCTCWMRKAECLHGRSLSAR